MKEMGKVLRALQCSPLVMQVSVQPPGMPPRDLLVRPMPDVYLMEQPNGQTLWVVVGMDLATSQMVHVPLDLIVGRSGKLLNADEIQRLIPHYVLDTAMQGAGADSDRPHDFSDDDLRDPEDVIDPAWQPPSANGHAPAPAAPASGPAGGATTPPG